LRIKYIIFLGIFLLGILFSSSICVSDPSVIVYDYELSPSLLMPGDNGTLTLTIKNAESTNTVARTTASGSTSTVYTDTRGATINNIWIVSDSDNNGKKVKTTLNYEDTGELAPATSYDITFKIIAEDGITEGLYFPTVRIDVETYTDVSFPIPVKVSNTTLDIVKKTIPSKIPMSGATDITLSVVNSRDLSFDGVNIIAEEIEGIEYISSNVHIGTIQSGSSEDVIFSIVPQVKGKYNLSFEMKYKNGDNFHKSTLSVPIEVAENYDVAPVIYSFPKTVTKGENADVRLEVYNAKTESISGVLVIPSSNVSISPSKYFIGSMDPDDVFSASFDIDTSDLKIDENYTLDFKVSFKQGDSYYETQSVASTFTVIKPNEKQNINPLFYVLAFIITIILIYLLIRFFKKRRISK